MESFSQHGQDRYVYETFFKDATKGCFVEIGAYDGVTLSNTLFFERHLGWQGLCIEPLPSAFAKLKASRAAVCVNCAVSDLAGVADFVDVDVPKYGKMYSGLRDEYDPRQVEFMETYASDAKLLQVPTRRLADILDENNIGTIDYMSIDTEGNELKILRSIDLKARDIRCFRSRTISRTARSRTIWRVSATGWSRCSVASTISTPGDDARSHVIEEDRPAELAMPPPS